MFQIFWRACKMSIQENVIKFGFATEENIFNVVNLFNDYRIFYKKKSDIEKAEKFILERIKNKESLIFTACCNDEMVGFAQVYPTFSSIQMEKIYVLNDLYVNEKYRSLGIGRSILQHVKEEAKKNNINNIVLETASNNFKAKSLYESFGFIRDVGMDTYVLTCSA